MPDPYLAISAIAADPYMTERLRACAAQELREGDPGVWVYENRYAWASSPSWGEKWSYAVETHPPDPENPDAPEYQPGADEAVITDADILSTVQALTGARD